MSDVVLDSRQMQSALKLQTSSGTGTCFVYGSKKGYFFVSAAHLLANCKVGEKVGVFYKKEILYFSIRKIFCDVDGYDIVAFVTNQPIGGAFDPPKKYGLFPGQPVKFLGFPHGLEGDYPNEYGFHTPLVRSAHWSGNVIIEGRRTMILDGFNNPGYSGGPVYCCGDDGEPVLIGVVSGYRYERLSHSKVYKLDEDGNETDVLDHYVKFNSGMIYATGSDACHKLFSTVDEFQPWP
jgi:hypothetical protein